MLNKYNIALLPKSKNAELVNFKALFQANFGNYQLGAGSLAHVTIMQCHMHSAEVDYVWECTVRKLGPVNLKLTFEQLSCITFDQNTYWVSLVPDQYELLCELNKQLLSILNVKPKRKFDPHMTLFNSQQNVSELVKNMKVPIIFDDFYLALGVCDPVGQLTKIIKSTQAWEIVR